MSRTTATVAVVAMILTGVFAAPADAKKKKKKRVERTIEHEYTIGSPGVSSGAGPSVGACLAGQVEGSACIEIPISASETYVKVTSVDQSGRQPYGILAQDTDDAQPGLEILGDFCGETPEPVAITPGLVLRVSLRMVGPPTCPGPTTAGNMTVVLSNIP